MCVYVCVGQGYFRPDPVPQYYAPESLPGIVFRPTSWLQYLPCNYTQWIAATHEFDNTQLYKQYLPAQYNPSRAASGFYSWGYPPVGGCFAFELPTLSDMPVPTWYRCVCSQGCGCHNCSTIQWNSLRAVVVVLLVEVVIVGCCGCGMGRV